MQIPFPPSECVGAREAVSRRLDGELAELDAARLGAHLRRCPTCREFAEQTAAIAVRLRRAPLETPDVAAFEPRRRRPASMSPLQAAAAVLAVVAAGSSFALGQIVGGRSAAPIPTAAVHTPADLGSARQDEIAQHLLALLPRLNRSQKSQIGSAVPL
jgi:predicted anti-sigma-YlaC factor YlaD